MKQSRIKRIMNTFLTDNKTTDSPTILGFLLKSRVPIPYTKPTPLHVRREFIKHLHEQGFKLSEIKKVYPTTNYIEIRKAIGL
jgi:hypothetical protein